MDKRELPGYKKKSFSMVFNGGEIWFEHLDGIHEYTDLAIEKLKRDYEEFNKPSKPSITAINLDETKINDELIEEIVNIFKNGQKKFRKIAFVGVNKQDQKKINVKMKDGGFLIAFINDYQKAKEWLV